MERPQYSTPFVGRERLLRLIDGAPDRQRPLTLVGPPGVGKRRLVAQTGFGQRAAWIDVGREAAADGVEEVCLVGASGAREATRAFVEAHPGAQVVCLAEEPIGLVDELVVALPPLSEALAMQLLDHHLSHQAPLDDFGEVPGRSGFALALRGFPGALELVARGAAALGPRIFERDPLTLACLEPLRLELARWFGERGEDDRATLTRLAIWPAGAPIEAIEEALGEAGFARAIVLGGLRRDVEVSVDPLIAHVVATLATPAELEAARKSYAAQVLRGADRWPESWSEDPELLRGLGARMEHFRRLIGAGRADGASDSAVGDALVAATAATRYLTEMGDAQEGLRDLDEAIEAARGRGVGPRAMAHALMMAERTRRKRAVVGMGQLDEAFELANEAGDEALAAHVRYARGVRASELREHDQARQLLTEVCQQAAAPGVRGHAMLRLAMLSDAERRAELVHEALRHFLQRGDLYGEIIARTYLMQVERDAGRIEFAVREGVMALELNERFGSATVVAFGELLLGRLYEASDELAPARRHYEASVRAYGELANAHAGGIAAMELGAVLMKMGELEEAYAVLEEASRRIAPLDQPDLDLTVLAHRGLLALAWHEVEPGDRAYAERAREIRDEIKAAYPDLEAMRRAPMLRACFRRLESSLEARGSDADEAIAAVSADGTWLQRGDEERVSIEKRRALRGILAALANDAPCSIDDLVVAGWPEESLTYESGRNRVYVAISTLRRLGLEGVIHFDEEAEGYVLQDALIRRRSDPA